MNMLEFLIQGIQWVLVFVGVAAVVRLLRRPRAVGDHPHCQKCNYDLHGLTTQTTRCPECGADLRETSAVVVGVRIHRSRRIATTALLIGALAVAWWGLGVGLDGLRRRQREIAMRPIVLTKAISAGDAKAVEALLKLDPRLATDDHSSYRPLQFAVICSKPEFVRTLLDGGALPDLSCEKGDEGAPLHLAAQRGSIVILEMLLTAGADPNDLDRQGRSPLHLAACSDSTGDAMVKRLLAAGADPSAVTPNGGTALHSAAFGYGKAVKALVAAGVPVNAPNRDGETPLHLALDYVQMDAAIALLECGADIGAKDAAVLTPCEFAAKRNRSFITHDLWCHIMHEKAMANRLDELAKLLKKEPMAVTYVDDTGTVLHEAAMGHNPDLVRVLIEAGADVNAQNQSGDTPLHYAGIPAVRRVLLEHGSDPNIRNKKGERAGKPDEN